MKSAGLDGEASQLRTKVSKSPAFSAERTAGWWEEPHSHLAADGTHLSSTSAAPSEGDNKVDGYVERVLVSYYYGKT